MAINANARLRRESSATNSWDLMPPFPSGRATRISMSRETEMAALLRNLGRLAEAEEYLRIVPQ
jgi:hypothetical protein